MKIIRKYTIEILLVVLTLILIVRGTTPTESTVIIEDEISSDTIYDVPVRLAWGFPFDSIQIDTSRVRSGQSLSNILRPLGISAQTVDRLARNSGDIFNLRRIKAGHRYYIIHKDSINTPSYLIYEDSQIDYVVFDLDSSIIYRGAKKVDTLQHNAGGVIKSSLWNAMVANNASPVLAVRLSDIFAWTIDFFGIQPNDEFKVIYDAHYVEGNYVGIGHIHAAKFIHMGVPTTAYYYEHNEQEGYFDDEGNSLRKAFLKAPLNYSRISSGFSNSRMHPVLKIRRAHHGVDYAAPSGTPVYSIGDGTVVKKGYQARGGGNYLNIRHNSVYTSQYMHLRNFAPGINQGTRVKQGQLIGYVGMTGLATGPHLDFRIFKNGSPVNPLNVEAPPVEPIAEENREHFNAIRDSLKLKLEIITTTNEEDLLISYQ